MNHGFGELGVDEQDFGPEGGTVERNCSPLATNLCGRDPGCALLVPCWVFTHDFCGIEEKDAGHHFCRELVDGRKRVVAHLQIHELVFDLADATAEPLTMGLNTR